MPPDRRQNLPWIWPLAGVGAVAGLAVAVAAHVTVLVALGLPVALVVTYAALEVPLVALALLQVVAWSNVSTVAGSHHGLSLYLLALAIGAISTVLAVNRGARSLFGRSPVYLLVALVIVVEGISLIASAYPLQSLATPTERLKDVAFFLVTIALIRVSGRLLTAVQLIVATIAILAGLTIIQQYLLHNSTTFGGLSGIPAGSLSTGAGSSTVRHTGPEADPNFWGRTIVLVTPLALSLSVLRWRDRLDRIGWRRHAWLGWSIAALALAGGEYLSQSRGGLLAFAVAGVGWLIVAAWKFRRWLLLLPVVLVLVVAGVPGLGSRLGTLTELTHLSANTTDPSLLERIQAQEVGLAMFRAHPATGVGVGNFAAVEPMFLDQPGVLNTGQIFAAHDLYLEIAAEQGVLGLGAWLLFYGGALFISIRALTLAAQLGNRDLQLISLGVLMGLVGWAAASAVLHLSDLNDLLAMIGLVTVIDIHVRREAEHLSPAVRTDLVDPIHRSRIRRARRGALAVGAATLAGGGLLVALITALVPLHSNAYAAQATASVGAAKAAASGNNAYDWDTVDRQSLLPTLATITGYPRFLQASEAQVRSQLPPGSLSGVTLKVTGDVANAVLRVTVDARNPQAAQLLADRTLANARTYLQGLISVYQIQPVTTSGATAIHPVKRPVALALAVLVLLTAWAALWAGRTAFRRSMRATSDQVDTPGLTADRTEVAVP